MCDLQKIIDLNYCGLKLSALDLPDTEEKEFEQLNIFNLHQPRTQKARGSYLSWLKLPAMQHSLLLLHHLGGYNSSPPLLSLFLCPLPHPSLPHPHFIFKVLIGNFPMRHLVRKWPKSIFQTGLRSNLRFYFTVWVTVLSVYYPVSILHHCTWLLQLCKSIKWSR